MQTSESIKNIASALLTFHAEVGNVNPSAVNPHWKSKYAPLSEILTAVKAPLQKAGLVVTQWPTGENELTTRLLHSSGEWMESTYRMDPAKNDPQGYGSAITYMRRYAIGAILSLNIDEDDDGNKASAPAQKNGAKPKAQPQRLTPAAFKKALDRIEGGEKDLIGKIRATYQLTPEQEHELTNAHTDPQ